MSQSTAEMQAVLDEALALGILDEPQTAERLMALGTSHARIETRADGPVMIETVPGSKWDGGTRGWSD